MVETDEKWQHNGRINNEDRMLTDMKWINGSWLSTGRDGSGWSYMHSQLHTPVNTGPTREQRGGGSGRSLVDRVCRRVWAIACPVQ